MPGGQVKVSELEKVWLVSILYWIVFGLLCVLLYPTTIADTMQRYAPMANAFARGDWHYAFHPRFGVLFQVLAGTVTWLTGLDGAWSVQVVAVGFIALAGPPLWLAVRRFFGERIAWWALALMFVTDDIARYAMDGLRDSGKCLAFALLGWGYVACRPVVLGLGLFVLVTVVSYGFAIGGFFLFAWCVSAVVRRRWCDVLSPVLGWSLGTLAVTWMVYAYTGYWLPVPHVIKFVEAWL